MKQRFSRRLLYILLLIVSRTIILLPYGFTLQVGKSFGFLAYLFLPKYSRITKQQLKAAFGNEKSQEQVNKIAKGVFTNLGINAAEVLNMPRLKKHPAKNIYSTGFEKIDRALAGGKGVVIISAHFGNWELLPLYYVAKGYPSNVIARRIYYEKYDEWVSLLRKNTGANIIFRDESPRKVLEAIKRNELVGIMPDQDIDSLEGVFINFFNMPAYTPSGPVTLAMRMECPILLSFIIREKNRHKIVIDGPIELEITSDKERDIVINTQKWSDVVESYIRKYPEQWVWMHRRWKTKPGPKNI